MTAVDAGATAWGRNISNIERMPGGLVIKLRGGNDIDATVGMFGFVGNGVKNAVAVGIGGNAVMAHVAGKTSTCMKIMGIVARWVIVAVVAFKVVILRIIGRIVPGWGCIAYGIPGWILVGSVHSTVHQGCLAVGMAVNGASLLIAGGDRSTVGSGVGRA